MAGTQLYSCTEIHNLTFFKSGAFGSVFKAKVNGVMEVAVKIVKGGDQKAAVSEIRRMRQLDHPNILKLIGVVHPSEHYEDECDCHILTDPSVSWMVLEFMPKGDLLSFIKGYNGSLPPYGMHKIAYQTALGMDHLHSVANLVHKDLAARNILVKNNNFDVKIGDFGFCDNYYDDHYYDNNGAYQNACPIRWMPPESLPDSLKQPTFSRKGDVWSFGVVLFEIWSNGMLPFHDGSDEHVIEFVKDGFDLLDLEQDFRDPSWVLQLMKQCFQFYKAGRPNFRNICETILDESEFNLVEQ